MNGVKTARRTKVVATVGPACNDEAGIRRLVDAGTDVIRLNCSHLSTADLERMIRLVRSVDPTVAVLVDIQGPKLRYGGVERNLVVGESHDFNVAELGIDVGGRGIAPGHRILFDDGRLEVRVTSVEGEAVAGVVVRGGTLRVKKGVNLPDTEVPGTVLTAKDRDDLAVVGSQGADLVAISFVQRAADVIAVRDIVGPEPLLVAKIERPQAVERLAEICGVADGVMAARGDLGVEMDFARLPALQKHIATVATQHGVFSVCATEMLESMITASRPTRAEVADVTGAVRDGFDAVMLSAETAVGADPARAVATMGDICGVAESDVSLPALFAERNPQRAAVTAAASALAKRVSADALLSLTYTGHSATLLALCRPGAPIIAATPSETVARQLRIVRGVSTVVAERASDVEVAIASALGEARRRHLVASGDHIVVCASRLSPRSDADTIWLHTEP
jgi:pyruvate kinase